MTDNASPTAAVVEHAPASHLPKPPPMPPAGDASPSRRATWVRRGITFALIAAAIGAVSVVGGIKPPEKEHATVEVPPVNVQVRRVEVLASMPDAFELPGVVTVNKVVKVSAEVDGRIDAVFKEEGDNVVAGEVIAVLNTDFLQADYDRAVEQEKFDRRDCDRVQELADKKIASAQEAEAACTKLRITEATAKTAKARLDRAKITAPMSGVLDKRPVEKGEYVGPGACIAQLVDINTVKVIVQVPERDVGKLRKDVTQHIYRDINGDGVEEAIPAKITYVGEVADDTTRTTRVELAVDNADRKLRSGQVVRASLSRGEIKDVILVPLLTVIPLEKGKEVYCVKDGKAVRKLVTLGFFKGDQIQIKSGLTEGEMLIVDGHRYVSDGQAVKVQPPASQPATGPGGFEAGAAQ